MKDIGELFGEKSWENIFRMDANSVSKKIDYNIRLGEMYLYTLDFGFVVSNCNPVY